MRKNTKRRLRGIPIVDPLDRDMRLEDARGIAFRSKIKLIVYQKLPPPLRCCSSCQHQLTNDDKVKGNDANGQECVIYICSKCKMCHRL